MDGWFARGRRTLPWLVAVAAAHAGALAWLWRDRVPAGRVSPALAVVVIDAAARPSPQPPPPDTGAPPAAPRTTPAPLPPSPEPDAAAPELGSMLAIAAPPTLSDLVDRSREPDAAATGETSAAGGETSAGSNPDAAVGATDVALAGQRDLTGGASDSVPAPSWSPPPQALWEYDVIGETRGLRYRASGVMHWRHTGHRYELELTWQTAWVGSRTQVSSGDLTAEGLRPLRYEERARRTRWLQFEWTPDDRTAQTLTDGGQRQNDVPAGTQDRLSLFVQLGGALAATTPVPGQRLAWPVSGFGRWQTWVFELRGPVPLALADSKRPAWHLVRLPEQSDDLEVEVWYAVDRPGLPLRVVLTQHNGDRVEQRLRRVLPAPS